MTTLARRTSDQTYPRRRELLGQLAEPLREFLRTEAGSAGLLLAAAVIALVWANTPLSDTYESIWTTEASVRIGDAHITMDLRHWVNDGLMFFFFLVIGLEVRRELTVGELNERATVTVSVLAALGGVVVPAAIYLAINSGGEAQDAWGAALATDTAFLLGALALIGTASMQLRVFMLTVTIFQDIVAVTVIAVFYSKGLDGEALLVAVACLFVVVALGRMEIPRRAPYILTGIALWVAAVESGIHPTIAGMAMGLAIPAYAPRPEAVERAAKRVRAFLQSPHPSLARAAQVTVLRALSPNERIQAVLHPVSSYVAVPLFALANAGVDMRGGVIGDALSSPVTWGMIAALVVGNLIGITGFALGAVRLGLGRLPRGVAPGQILGGAALSGIGFTLSLLIIELGVDSPELQDEAKVGVLAGSVLALVLGWTTFRLVEMLGKVPPPSILDPPVDPARDHIRGRPDAPLTLAEFADFECPFCAHSTGMIEDLRRRFGDELRYVFRHLPLMDVHGHAELAAEASEAAAAQGRFWEYHDVLFQHQDQLEFEDLLGYAGDLDLDVEQFARDLEEGVHSERVREDVASAEASGARGTPTFFVNGVRHEGPYDAATLARELTMTRRG